MAPATPPRKPKGPPTKGIIATTDTGKKIRLAGPPKPERYGNKWVLPDTEFSPRVIKTRPAPKKTTTPKRVTPKAQKASVVPLPGDRQRLNFLPGKDPRARDVMTGRRPYEPPSGPWRHSLNLLNERKRIEQSVRRANYQGPLAFLGRTIQKNSQTAMDIITGLPGAAIHGVEVAATAARALGKDPTATASDQIEAAKSLGREAAVTGQYYGGLAKDFATRPTWAIENRLLEGGLAVAGAWSGLGQGVGWAARMARPAAAIVRGAEQTGSLRGGVRVARAQARADVIAQDRARRGRGDRSRPAGAPMPGALPGASFVFRNADQVLNQAERAAEVTGNVVGGSAVRTLERIADWGSKSTLTGSARARGPRRVVPPTRDLRGRDIGPTDAQGVRVGPSDAILIPRRPRSSNPLTRSVQRRITEPVGAAVRSRVEPVLQRLPFVPDEMTRAVRAQARNIAYAVPENVDRGVLTEGGSFAKMVKRLKRSSTLSPGLREGLPDSQVATGVTAAVIRAMGAAEDMGGSRVWGRDRLIDRTRQTLSDPNAGLTRRQRKSLEDNLKTLEEIPDEWLDPSTAPKWLNDLEGEARRISTLGTDIKRQMGLITADSAEWAGRRAQAQLMGARPLRRVVGQVTKGGYTAGYVGDRRLARAIGEELEYRRSNGRSGKSRERFQNYSTEALEIRQKAVLRRAQTMRGRVAGYLRAADESALAPYRIVREARAAVTRAEERLAAARKSGSARSVEAATRELIGARRRYANQRTRARRTAYVGSDLPERAGMKPGVYIPQRTTRRDAVGARVSGSPTQTARMTPPRDNFNASVLMDRGDISFSPRQIINTLREALDARERVAAASAVITKFAVRSGDRLLEGNAAREFVKSMGGDGNVYSLISERQLARISSLSANTTEGQRLMRMLDESINPKAERVYVVPTAAIKGWNDALGPARTGAGRTIDYINTLWKGGVLALSPRWYVQNMIGMWGQFVLGAGADLQAINMATGRKYLEDIPGRISAMGLAQEYGEYARRMEGQGVNPVGGLIRWGYHANESLEAVPRRAMFWHAAKRGLRENDFIKGGVMDEGYLARAWLDVVEGAKRGDPGAERILDDVIVETERFMGNYSRYNAFERRFLRRIFPFYGWMRSINRLAFALPVKHPKRAAILSMASLMAYDMYGMERNELTGYRTGLFTGGRQIGMNTMVGLQTTIPTFQAIKAVGHALEETNPRDPASVLDFVGTAGVEAFKAAAEQAGPLVGTPYTWLSGKTLGGVPLQFSPGYQGFNKTYTGQYERIDPATGRTENGTPTPSFITALEQSFPLINQGRKLLAGGAKPYADASTASLANWALLRGRDPKTAPFLVQNDPKSPATSKTDLSSFLLNVFAGVPADKVDPQAIWLQQAQEYKRMWARLTAAQRKVILGEYQQRQRNRRG